MGGLRRTLAIGAPRACEDGRYPQELKPGGARLLNVAKTWVTLLSGEVLFIGHYEGVA